MTTSPQPESPEPLKVALQPMTPGIFAGDLAMFPSPDGKYCRLSAATAAIQAARNEAEAMRAALQLAVDHIDMDALRISHCKDAAAITAAINGDAHAD